MFCRIFNTWLFIQCFWLFSFHLSSVAAEFVLQSNAGASYVLGAGDVLEITTWKDAALTKQVVVLPDGSISFPLIGEVVAAGKSVNSLQKELETKIRNFVTDPVLAVVVTQVNSMVIYVLGKVIKPGRFSINTNVNVLQALAIAGGLNPYAKKDRIKIIREEGGATKVFDFDFEAVLKETNLDKNIRLMRNDLVLVP